MKKRNRFISLALTLGLALSVMVTSVSASKFVDAHGNELELDDTLEAYSSVVLSGAVNAIRHADTLIIGGTSLVVYPAAGLIRYFRGDHLVVINMQPTNADAEADLCIAKPIGQVLSEDVVVDD